MRIFIFGQPGQLLELVVTQITTGGIQSAHVMVCKISISSPFHRGRQVIHPTSLAKHRPSNN
jgi:hypothetical protein